MITVTIPGGTALLRERQDLRVRHRHMIQAAAMAAGSAIAALPDEADQDTKLADLHVTAAQAASLLAMEDATIVALLAGWSLPDPLPTLETVGDMDPAVYDALAAATRKLGADVASGVNFEPTPDQGSPTPPSTGSDGGLRDETSTLTPQPLSVGGNTPTAAATPGSPMTTT